MKESTGTEWSHCLRSLVCCLLASLFGCQVPPARVSSTAAAHPYSSRTLLLTRQLTADSAVVLAAHPWRCGCNAIAETVEHVSASVVSGAGKRLSCRYEAPAPLSSACPPLPPTGPPDERYQPAHFALYPEPCAALEALHQLIDQATEHIDVAMFLWDSDGIGAAVAAWLTARAAAGVPVRVLIDGGGNLIFGKVTKGVDVNTVICTLAQQPNVEVIRTRDAFGCFDHRKLVLVDGRAAWTGGRNLSHQSFFGQHDLSLVVAGPLVHDLQRCFEEAWQEQGGGRECRVSNAECRVQSEKGDFHPALCTLHSPFSWARFIQSGPKGHHLAAELYEAVEQAQHHIYLENGYLSDGRLVCKLAQARQRGVDVRVVVTLSSKEALVDCANRVTANRLREAGVRVYICPWMTHTKAAVIDGCWAYVGTGNYDALSLRHNWEFGLVIGAGPLLSELEGHLVHCRFVPHWELTQPLPVTWTDYLAEMVMCLCL